MRDARLLRREPDGTLVTHAELGEHVGGHPNDMVVDAQGRAYVGNFGFDLMGGAPVATAALLRVDPDGGVTPVAQDMWFSNGSVITDDGVLIVDETFGNRVSAFDIAADGALANRRTWAKFAELPDRERPARGAGPARRRPGRLLPGRRGRAVDRRRRRRAAPARAGRRGGRRRDRCRHRGVRLHARRRRRAHAVRLRGARLRREGPLRRPRGEPAGRPRRRPARGPSVRSALGELCSTGGVPQQPPNRRAFSAGVADDGGVVELRVPGVGSLTGRIAELRARLGADVFQKVAGDEGPNRRKRIHSAPGPRWFAPDRPIRRVHGDASMFVGGLRALLLQSLHPLAMAGVAGHSGYRGDPWGRLARTSYFLAATTFGPDAEARETIERIKSVHARVRGRRAGRPRLLGRRPAPAGVGAHRGDRQLPAGPPALRLPPARPGGPRRVRGRHRPDRARARRARPAGDRGGARGADRGLPAGARRAPPRPARRPGSSCSTRRSRSPPARRTRCSPRRRWSCCRRWARAPLRPALPPGARSRPSSAAAARPSRWGSDG